jgi:Family of unknown function (DUF6502)
MSKNSGSERKARREYELDALLLQILCDIAAILLSSGYGYLRMTQIAKHAFVRAALSVAGGPESRTSIARIAAITGLTRIDVSQIVRSPTRSSAHLLKPTNRVGQVATGWLTDSNFRDRGGRPRTLRFIGAANSFSALVKKYSGDIPPRAMAEEMSRLGIVRRETSGHLKLIRSVSSKSPKTARALQAVVPWTNFLAHASVARSADTLLARTDDLRIGFSSLPQVFAAVRELHTRHRTFVASLESLGSRANVRHEYSLDVTAALATTNPRRSVCNDVDEAKVKKRRRRK